MDGFHSLWGLGQCENANPFLNVGECHVTLSTEACWVPVSWDYTDCLSVKPSALLPTFKEQKTLNLSQKLEKFGALGFLPQMEHRIGWCWEAACISLLGLPWQVHRLSDFSDRNLSSHDSHGSTSEQGVSRMAFRRPQSWGFLLSDEHALPVSSQSLPSVLACVLISSAYTDPSPLGWAPTLLTC